ncbi:putative transporter small subunit [Janibacter sp. GS2]
MSIAALTFYVLIWPALVAIVLAVICVGFVREFRSARKQGRDIV